jgi:hypothetical protein
VPVLPTDPHTERQPAGGQLADGRQLPRDEHRMAQRKQVEADVHRQLAVGQERRRRDQPVRSRADVEAHVITDAEVVDARIHNLGEPPARQPRSAGELAHRGEYAHSNTVGRARLRRFVGVLTGLRHVRHPR